MTLFSGSFCFWNCKSREKAEGRPQKAALPALPTFTVEIEKLG
jgi:hypothetical protein